MFYLTEHNILYFFATVWCKTHTHTHTHDFRYYCALYLCNCRFFL